MTTLARTSILIAILAALPRASAAQPAEPPDLEAVAGDLHLTPAQRERVREVSDAGRKEQIALRAEMDVVEIDLRRELEKGSADEARAGTLAVKLGTLEGTFRKSRIVTWLRLRKLLTADQRRTLERARVSDDGPAPTPPRPPARGCDEVTCLVEPGKACCKEATLAINAIPWARIVLDGKAVGTTPLVMKVAPGRHTVRAEGEAGARHTRQVEVAPGETVRLALDMSGGPSHGADLDEHLDRTAISSGISKVKPDVAACGRHVTAQEIVKAQIVIGPSGAVTSVVPSGGAPDLRACVEHALRKATFPASRLGITVNYPFVFKP